MADTTAVILDEERTRNAAAAAPANLTVLTPLNPVPVMVAFVPAALRAGRNEWIRGAVTEDTVADASALASAGPGHPSRTSAAAAIASRPDSCGCAPRCPCRPGVCAVVPHWQDPCALLVQGLT